MKKTAVNNLLPIFIFLVTASLLHAGLPASKGPVRVYTNQVVASDFEFFDANRIGSWITNEGEIVSFRLTGNAGMEWPRGSGKTINFQSGIWIGGMVGAQIRTAVAEYVTEFTPGVFEGAPDNQDDPRFRIYTIDKNSGPGDVDWDEWPVGDGAPTDGNGDPLLLGDKTYWSVFNDADIAAHAQLFNTPPLGVEVQQTIWGYVRTGAYGDMMFVKYLVINKGVNTINDAYLSFWSDIDLGNATDDFVASDTVLSLGYHYNDGSDAVYGDSPPAIGYDFFQGPIVPSSGDTAYAFGRYIPNYKNLPMTSFAHYVNGGELWESDPQVAVEMYNFMKGLDGLGNLKVDHLGNVTKFSYTGDPVAGTGWLRDNSGDMRFLMTSGPFTLSPSDSQEIVTGIVISQGTSPLSSVTALKEIDKLAQIVYDRRFQTHEVSLLSPNGGEVLS